MDTKRNKMCKMRLRRLRPDMVDKSNTKRGMTTADLKLSSSSSEDEVNADDDSEKISLKLRSNIALGRNKDFDPYVLLTEAQAVLKLSSENECNSDVKESENCKITEINNGSKLKAAIMANEKPDKQTKRCKKEKYYYPPLKETTTDAISSKSEILRSSIENDIYDLIYYHSDEDGPCNSNCNHARTSASMLVPTDRRSSSDSSSSLLLEKCSMRFSKLFANSRISVMDHEIPPTALSKILSIKEFDPLTPQQSLAIIFKSIISLAELSQRDDNIVCIDIDKRRILEFSAMTPEEKRSYPLNPYMDVSNIVVTHSDDDFLTFCLCENCEKYRELVIYVMVEQFKTTHMVVMLLDVLIKAYAPLLKNITAYNKFEKLLDSNKEIYWITSGVIYHKKAEHLNFIYDEYLSDNMIFVLFSSILMLNNPLLLLQILAFHVECIVKAYADGLLEIVEPDKSKIPADNMINYILDGYDDLMRISEMVASYFFAFENDFLRKFSLTWKLLCQRLYQQHVHLHLADTMLACIITLKEEELTSHYTDLIKRYIQFYDIMNYVEKRWTDVWIKLNKFNMSDVERKRRKYLLDVYRIFDIVVQDAIGFSLQDSVDDNNFYDFQFLKNRRLAWKNIMSYTKMKWPDGFFKPPNTLVVDDKCQICNVSLEYHSDYCKCITCSIAGGPALPRRNAGGKCSKCLAQENVEKDVNFCDSKILNVCANDDFQNLVAKSSNNGINLKRTTIQEVGQELYPTLVSVGEILNVSDYETNSETIKASNRYHISWAVFNHLNNRKGYPYATIETQYFCRDCKLPSCLLALKILNNKISPSLSQDLVRYYQPISMSREELRSILPNIMLYNRKLVACNDRLDLLDVHDLVVKIYWIFIISIYAIYFIDYNDDGDNNDNDYNASNIQGDKNTRKHSYLDVFKLENNDIKINVDKLTGNKDDTKFLEFLDKIKSLSPYNNDVESNLDVGNSVISEEMQKKLDDFLKLTNNQGIHSECDAIPSTTMTTAEDEKQIQPSSLISETKDSLPKKSCKEKCCSDHSETGGDHCKENHSSKKWLKKDCNHARMNETRDRLRKKLSQIMNTKKNAKPLELIERSQASSKSSTTGTRAKTVTKTEYSDARNVMEHFLNPEELKLFQHCLPRPDFWDIYDVVASFDHIYTEAKSNEEKKNLCECLQSLKINSKSESKNKNSFKKVHYDHRQVRPEQQLQRSSQHEQNQQEKQKKHDTNQSSLQQSLSLEQSNKKSNLKNNCKSDASTSSQGTKSKECNSSSPTIPVASSQTSNGNNLDFVNEICEIIDNYSKEQAKRKWIKETLSFIEGPTAGTGKKKTQPQTSNPKKAAKKAKQKQRKEEEKRIAELLDLRAQFHNIYFKEFSEKLNLKSLKANKKRDKRRISELETNIKNLQRAKAKVENAILELIATVKQTNTEFKFPYLPTKEQQLDKIRELEGHDSKESDRTIKVRNLLHHTTKEAEPVASATSNSPFTMSPINNLNMVPESYSMPYAHANHFPYNLGFATPAAAASPAFGLMRGSPMCYAPPSATAVSSVQQQHLAPNFVSAMASNCTSNNTTDPSKRIVTIRRVNLPNVPEPQVTVTAKGLSPDKDKLLYTFINGQLIQTGTAPPITIPHIPVSQPTSVTKLTAEHLISIPSPPPSKLSKTQRKKERKRLAKLEKEDRKATEDCDRKRIEEEHKNILKKVEKQKELEMQQLYLQEQKSQPRKKKKSLAIQQQSEQPYITLSSNNKVSSSHNKNKLSNSNSTTSVSTNENNESPKLPQMITIKNSTKHKRSVSTTTSCSAATSTSSNNSTSSQMNTRDNSVSSLRPVDLKRYGNKSNGAKEQKVCSTKIIANKIIKTKTSQLKQTQNKKLIRIPPTASTTSSDVENEEGKKLLKTKETKFIVPASPLPFKTQKQQTHAFKSQQLINQPKNMSEKLKSSKKPKGAPSSETETENENVTNSENKLKEQKERRAKFVDNGQFDNNPFKTLHMQDSETEWSSAEEDEIRDTENEVIKTKKASEEEEKVKQKNEKKLKKKEGKASVKTASQSQRKNIETKAKENKTQQPLTCLTPINKNLTYKSSKTNKNMNYQQQYENPDKLDSRKNHNTPSGQQILLKDEYKSKNQTRILKKNIQQNTVTSNSPKAKNDNPILKTKPNSKLATTSSSIRNEQTSCSRSSQNNCNNKNQNKLDQNQHNYQNSQMASSTCGNIIENKNESNKKSQRNKKYQQKSQKYSLSHHQNCCSSGIPNHMGYFNANDVNLTSPATHNMQQTGYSNTVSQNHSYQTLGEQMQTLNLSGHQEQLSTSMVTAQQRHQHINSANVSIMDQLNRGVQVENLSLPPGITLTKVDPIKSEQLRQKSESIKKLAKPLQQQHHHQQQLTQNTPTFHHSSSGGAIIAPPGINTMNNYYGSPYINTASTGLDPQNGVIMVEANPPKRSNVRQTNVPNSCSNKQSKNKKRRNKSKSCPMKSSANNEDSSKSEKSINGGQPKMITLRNPMFHSSPAAAAAAILQQPIMLPGRPVDALPMSVSLPVDQPAAIIKNENGMYTIRNPALHQAVTNGLVMGGYRQFGGNVNYYTPQEAAAEAARATLQQQQQQHKHKQQLQQKHNEDSMSSTTSGNNPSSSSPSSFSYFSNDAVQTNASHKNISISCTSIGGSELNTVKNSHTQRSGNSLGILIDDAAVIKRPSPQQQRPISAIGSEIKSAQQQKHKVEQQWSNFVSDAPTNPISKNDNLGCSTSFLGTVSEGSANPAESIGGGCGMTPIVDLSLQEKYQQSKYYNGFDVFTGSSGGSSSSGATCAHMHHSCGDDSPPPSITSYNSYLDGIPNTGVIRYDDASFLKNLIPGQNLNNEVSIHNINDSNFVRNEQSPQAHRVEISPVYGNRTPSTSLYKSSSVGQGNQNNFRCNYRDSVNGYHNDGATIFPNNMHLKLNEVEMGYDFEKPSPTIATSITGDTNHKTILDFKDLLIKNGSTGPTSRRASPYLDENKLEGFVQNMNSLQIASTPCEEQSSQLNGSEHCVRHGTTTTTSANNPSNGWW